MPWPKFNNDQQVTFGIACTLWGACFLIVGMMFYRSLQGSGFDASPEYSGSLTVFLVSGLATLGSWVFRNNRSELAPEFEIGRCLLAFTPGLALTAKVVPVESNGAILIVLVTFLLSAAVLYFHPGQSNTNPHSFTPDTDVSLKDYATQLRLLELQIDDSLNKSVLEHRGSPVTKLAAQEKISEEAPPEEPVSEKECCDLFGEHSEWVTQEFRRTKTPEGAEAFEGYVKIDWEPGQKTTVLNIPFAPPFSECPEIYCEPNDGCPSRTKVAECRPFGTRIEVRLPQECKEQNYSYVHILACLNVDESEQEEPLSA